MLALKMMSASISAARRADAVSVEKNGLPVPQPKMTTRPFSRCRMARLRMYGSATWFMAMAVCTRTSQSSCSSASARASALMVVASIPM